MGDKNKSDNSFFAMISRMKYIERWALMRNSLRENVCEHSLETAVIAHALAVIGNCMLDKDYDAEHIAMLALYHDCTEIITGDMPTPVKYANDELKEAYKAIEDSAAHRLLEMLPEDLRAEYESYFLPEQITPEEYRYVKAADKLSALIKCIEEEKTGNQEFRSAKQATYESLQQMNMPEVTVFCEVFLPEYYKTLDELEH